MPIFPGTRGFDAFFGADYVNVMAGSLTTYATGNIDNDEYTDVRATVASVSSGNALIDSIIHDTQYAQDSGAATYTITYSFPDSDSLFASSVYDANSEPYVGFEAFSAEAQGVVREIFVWLESITNLRFVEVDDSGTSAGTIRFGWTEYDYALAWADLPANWVGAGDIWFSADSYYFQDREDSHLFQQVLLHELGHALGLVHASGVGREYTLMSGDVSERLPSLDWTSFQPQTFMSLDIQALQHMYGTNTSATAGNDQYSFDLSQQYYLTIYDAAGNDTIRVEDANGSGPVDTKIDLTPGSWSGVGTTLINSSGGASIAETVFIMDGVVVENAYGNAGNDTLVGNSADNILAGASGNDLLSGSDGDDTLAGGAGADTLDGGVGTDLVSYDGAAAAVAVDLQAGTGSAGDAAGDVLTGFEQVLGSGHADTLVGTTGHDTVWGGAGNDIIFGKNGIDTLFGDAGDDHVAGDGGHDWIDGGAGNDTVIGGSGRDTLLGSDGNDSLYGATDTDTLEGGSGNDTLEGGDGADVLDGGAGTDIASYASAGAGIAVDLVAGTGSVGDADGDILTAIEQLLGSNHGDTITGSLSHDTVWGAAGDDTIYGKNGMDALFGDEGNDLLAGDGGHDWVDGGSGDDTVIGGSGRDTLFGSAGDDSLYGAAENDTLEGGAGNDTLDGGEGTDMVSYASSGAAISLDLVAGVGIAGDAAGDTFISIEQVLGSSYGDTITGSLSHDTIWGADGDDTIYGKNGMDTLFGDGGNDFLVGDGGHDWIDGGDGSDTVLGGTGRDTLHGGDGADSLNGAAENDFLSGGAGADTLEGGTGNDIFAFADDGSSDTVTDFTNTEDLLDFSVFGVGYDDLVISQSGADVVILIGNNSVTLLSVNVADIGASDFVF